MKKYGFFGGSFNPPTKAHIYLAEKVINDMNLDKLFFVPVGNNYSKKGLIDEKYRFEMLKLICDKKEKMEVLDIEMGINEELKAIDVFKLIKERYHEEDLYYIMGADNLAKISEWRDADELIKNYKFIILQRSGYSVIDIIENNSLLFKYRENVHVLENKKHSKTSSTKLRNKIKSNNIDSDIPQEIQEYIKDNKLY